MPKEKLRNTYRFFNIPRSQAFRVVVGAFARAGILRPMRDRDRVGAAHILRHSGAIECLKRTGNPNAVQDQLRHKSALMMKCYLKLLSADKTQLDHVATEGLSQCSPRSFPGYSFSILNCLQCWWCVISTQTYCILHMVIHSGKLHGKLYGVSYGKR